jgi:hypothetical protein
MNNRYRNIFVLCTGRCGSTTFIKACSHAKNYTAGHETQLKKDYDTIEARLKYPANHIEADNRLSFFLGLLDKLYGSETYYVHLKRDVRATAASYIKRKSPRTLYKNFNRGILYKKDIKTNALRDMIQSVVAINANISHFLKDKKHSVINIENPETEFALFCGHIRADINLKSAANEFKKRYNKSK